MERLRASQDDLGEDTEAPADVTERINALEKVRVDGDPTLTLSQAATKPESPSGPPMAVIVLLAALAGFTLGLRRRPAARAHRAQDQERGRDRRASTRSRCSRGSRSSSRASCAAARPPAGTCCPLSGRRSGRS